MCVRNKLRLAWLRIPVRTVALYPVQFLIAIKDCLVLVLWPVPCH